MNTQILVYPHNGILLSINLYNLKIIKAGTRSKAKRNMDIAFHLYNISAAN